VRPTVGENEIENTLCDVTRRDRARGNRKSALQQHPRQYRATNSWGDRGRACGKIDGRRSLNVIILSSYG